MKTIMIIAIILCAFAANAQSYVQDKTGNIVKKEKAATTAKPADPIVAIKDGITFYQGAKGGIYYYKSRKDGSKYKCYVKKEK